MASPILGWKAWVAAGKAVGLFTIIQCGSDVITDAVELAAYSESIGADGIGSVGPYEELCADTACVVDWVAPVAAAAPKTPFFYCQEFDFQFYTAVTRTWPGTVLINAPVRISSLLALTLALASTVKLAPCTSRPPTHPRSRHA